LRGHFRSILALSDAEINRLVAFVRDEAHLQASPWHLKRP
jgi:hypothetical protein